MSSNTTDDDPNRQIFTSSPRKEENIQWPLIIRLLASAHDFYCQQLYPLHEVTTFAPPEHGFPSRNRRNIMAHCVVKSSSVDRNTTWPELQADRSVSLQLNRNYSVGPTERIRGSDTWWYHQNPPLDNLSSVSGGSTEHPVVTRQSERRVFGELFRSPRHHLDQHAYANHPVEELGKD